MLDLFGDGFVLQAFDNPAAADPLAKAAATRGVPLRIVPITDAAAARLYEFPYVLVRPDGHVAWRGSEAPADALAVVDTTRGGAVYATNS